MKGKGKGFVPGPRQQAETATVDDPEAARPGEKHTAITQALYDEMFSTKEGRGQLRMMGRISVIKNDGDILNPASRKPAVCSSPGCLAKQKVICSCGQGFCNGCWTVHHGEFQNQVCAQSQQPPPESTGGSSSDKPEPSRGTRVSS